MKTATKGKKFIIAYGLNYLFRVTKSGAKLTSQKDEAQKFTQIDAIIKAKKFGDVEVMPV